jgi:hypothetical protein
MNEGDATKSAITDGMKKWAGSIPIKVNLNQHNDELHKQSSKRTIEVDPIVFHELELHRASQNAIKRLNKDDYDYYYDYDYDYHDHDFVFAKTEKNKGYPKLIKTVHNRMTFQDTGSYLFSGKSRHKG